MRLAQHHVVGLLAAVGLVLLPGCTPPRRHDLSDHFTQRLLALEVALDRVAAAASAPSPDRDSLRLAYASARRAFKLAEPLIEEVFPPLGFLLNNRSVDGDHDEAPPPPEGWTTTGFPALEPPIFGGDAVTGDSSLAAVARHTRGLVAWGRQRIPAIRLDDSVAHAALRHGIARLGTLGIAGYDAAPVGDVSQDVRAVLEGLDGLAVHLHDGQQPAFRRALGVGLALTSSPSGDPGIDPLAFIVSVIRPAAAAVDASRRAKALPQPADRGIWRGRAASPYDAGAFDSAGFAAGYALTDERRAAAVGARLFVDPRLSADGRRHCATCHDPAQFFTDGRARGRPRPGTAVTLRNTPTLHNVALHGAWFADARVTTLEDQIAEVLTSPAEMGTSLDAIVDRLRRDSTMTRAFAEAFALPPAEAVSPVTVRHALGAHLRTLTALETPVDAAWRGDTTALRAEARLGFRLFMGKARCATCHFAPLFSGVVPPLFREAEVEVIGVPDAASGPGGRRLSADAGREAVDGLPHHRGAFRTTPLRGVGVTAPYFHNGSFASLDAVIEFYDAGGGAGRGLVVPNQTLPKDSLHLTRDERHALVEFLHALTPFSHRSSRPAMRETPTSTRRAL